MLEIKTLIAEKYETGKINDTEMVQLIQLIADYLNPVPLLKFSKDNNISYPGILKSKRFKVVNILKKKFVIDNA